MCCHLLKKRVQLLSGKAYSVVDDEVEGSMIGQGQVISPQCTWPCKQHNMMMSWFDISLHDE